MIKNKRQPKPDITVDISNLSHEGRGIAQQDGKVHFVAHALPGETVKCRVTRRNSRFNEGIATEILKAAAERITPACPHFGICGGCSLQHLSSEQQLHYKQQWVLEQFTHIAGITPESLAPAITGPSWGYRHKARIGVKYDKRKDRMIIGFRELINPRFVANCESCEVLHPAIGKQLSPIKEALAQLSCRDQIPQLEVAIGDNAAAIIVRHLVPLTAEDEQQLIHLAQQYDYHIYLQPKGPKTIHRLWPAHSTTEELLYYTLVDQGLTLYFHPADFTQVNPTINAKMVNQALNWLNPQPTDTFMDLFCGLGNFSLPLAQKCQQVVAVEGNPQAVQRGQANAQANHLDNVTFHCADLTEDHTKSAWFSTSCNKLLLDPARSGAIEILQQFPAGQFECIVYVSCNPATLARDCATLLQQGYRLKKLGIINMFPQTSHVETMALFETDPGL